MNCPLCDAELEESGRCVNCGWTAEDEKPTAEETRADRYAELPGIYYQLLEEDDGEDEIVRRRSRRSRKGKSSGGSGQSGAGLMAWIRQVWRQMDPTSRRNVKFTAGMFGGTLLLFLIIAQFYAPNAAAMTGNRGVSMSNREFYLYYRSAYSSYLSSCTDSSGNTSVPFSSERSLDRQYYDLETGYSWQDYFMDSALQTAAVTEILAKEAEDSGMSLSEEEDAEIEAQLETIEEGYEGGLKAYLQACYGRYMTVGTYRDYLQKSTLAQDYYESLYNSITYTEDEIRSYYQSNSGDYTDLTVSDMPNVNVRHILYIPTGDSQTEWDAAEALARAALAECESSDDPLSAFLALVGESQDSGSSGNGGLLENVYEGAIGGTFDDWCFDPAGHEAGELAVVMSGYGWHLVMFDSYCDTAYWQEVVQGDMRETAAARELSELYDEYDCELTVFADVPD